jgi:SAM-dependent methyltransferase
MAERRQFNSLIRHYHQIQEALSASGLPNDPTIASETEFMGSVMYMHGVARDLNQMISRISTGRVLDFGCGTGIISTMMALSGLSVTGIEIESDVPNIHGLGGVEWTHRSDAGRLVQDFLAEHFPVSFLRYEGRILPWDTSEFDAIVAYAVVEHIDKELLGPSLDEMVRVLKPGGLLFIFRCPRTWALTERLSRSHERLVGEGELRALMVDRGLDILKFGRTDFFPEFAPVAAQSFWNLISPLLIPIQRVLDRVPTSIFSHNMWLVSKKVAP